MTLDHITWHLDEDYPADLPRDQAATHIGLYWAWAVSRDLIAADIAEQCAADIAAVRERRISGRDFVLEWLGGELTSEDLNPLGQRFSAYYYEDEDEGYGAFMLDYVTALNTADLPSFYHVADNWANFDKLAPVFDAALARWQASLKTTQ